MAYRRGHSDRRERSSVNRTGPEKFQAAQVFAGAITFMPGKIVSGIKTVQISHPLVSVDFRNNGCGRNGRRLRVALYDSFLGKREIDLAVAVHKKQVRGAGKTEYRSFHCKAIGVVNIEPVYFSFGSNADTDKRVGGNFKKKLFSSSNGDLLAVVDSIERSAAEKNHSRRHDRAGKRAAASFVDACDIAIQQTPRAPVKPAKSRKYSGGQVDLRPLPS